MQHNDFASERLLNKLKRDLRKEMVINNFDPEGEIITDGEQHEFDAYIDGKTKSAFYWAMLNPLNSKGPLLIAVYGLIDEGHLYCYSSKTME
jgi:hypothetical protein